MCGILSWGLRTLVIPCHTTLQESICEWQPGPIHQMGRGQAISQQVQELASELDLPMAAHRLLGRKRR